MVGMISDMLEKKLGHEEKLNVVYAPTVLKTFQQLVADTFDTIMDGIDEEDDDGLGSRFVKKRKSLHEAENLNLLVEAKEWDQRSGC